MTYHLKRVIFVLIAGVMLIALSACNFSKPCESCGDTPTKGYTNKSSGEKEYYCSGCSSDCAFCSDKATEHYTALLGIVFVCDDCYEEIQELNS